MVPIPGLSAPRINTVFNESKRKKTGITLLEIIIVMMMLGVLATVTVSMFRTNKEGAIDKVAVANLKLIQIAQKAKLANEGEYLSASNTAEVNSGLRIFLPYTGSGDSLLWNYKAEAAADAFTAKAQRNGDDSRVMCVAHNSTETYSCSW